jgi:hypothetical protein
VTSAFSDSDLPFIAARICIGGAAGALALSPRPALLLTFYLLHAIPKVTDHEKFHW